MQLSIDVAEKCLKHKQSGRIISIVSIAGQMDILIFGMEFQKQG